ncbi:hypothetical protein D3C87_1049910 [compost metagenome]
MREHGTAVCSTTQPPRTIVQRYDPIGTGMLMCRVHELQDRVDTAAQALDVLRIKLMPVSREVRTGDADKKGEGYDSSNSVGREIEATIHAMSVLIADIKEITDHLEV